MTKEEILAMEGRPLDFLIEDYIVKPPQMVNAIRLYLRSRSVLRRKLLLIYTTYLRYTTPRYSTDTSAAWQVWLAVTKDAPENWAIYSGSNGEVTVEHYPDDFKGDRKKSWCDFSADGQFPEAMCKVALLALNKH